MAGRFHYSFIPFVIIVTWYLLVPIYLLGLYNAIVYLANPSDNEMELMISTSSFMKVMNY